MTMRSDGPTAPPLKPGLVNCPEADPTATHHTTIGNAAFASMRQLAATGKQQVVTMHGRPAAGAVVNRPTKR